jgi:hypothetical protein
VTRSEPTGPDVRTSLTASAARRKQEASRPLRHPRIGTRRAALIPSGAWPRRMSVELAAGYCGETTVDAFMARVGKEYPLPRVSDGRRKLWLKDDLDQAILPDELRYVADVAADL